MNGWAVIAVSAALVVTGAQGALAQDAGKMSFFITSAGPGKGGDLGGIEGADRHCQALAAAAGAGGMTWRAYLSADAAGGRPAVNARDRIGNGPWHNAKGVMIARDLDDLHGPGNKIDKLTGLTEKGMPVNGRGDRPNMHDILTGSNAMGMGINGMNCANWTSGASDHRGFVGHHDRRGLRDDAPSKSWNSSHPSRGCTQANLRRSGGNGLFYCFAEK